ncbi:response regulator transcription factor [Streptosporangiaceae bacterium NEAU-GS5]|nr:response regulator transcription factor [Streptosporangiaceae bacterium NEAU-GS5]
MYVRESGWKACSVTLQCLVVDDSPYFLDAARALLERQGIAVVGVATNGPDALRRVRELRPDVTLVDIDLGGESGFDLARRLSADGGDTALSPVILVSTRDEVDYAELIATSPALGFVAKAELSADAVRALLSGHGSGQGHLTA